MTWKLFVHYTTQDDSWQWLIVAEGPGARATRFCRAMETQDGSFVSEYRVRKPSAFFYKGKRLATCGPGQSDDVFNICANTGLPQIQNNDDNQDWVYYVLANFEASNLVTVKADWRARLNALVAQETGEGPTDDDDDTSSDDSGSGT